MGVQRGRCAELGEVLLKTLFYPTSFFLVSLFDLSCVVLRLKPAETYGQDCKLLGSEKFALLLYIRLY
uniref:Macaca fascicularis brain cDNA, clone: QflA-21863 n=1 Tax=Macaca fascicularis TaxID=9541 RepID=I7GNQ1_MACFA|nr:unnamed protein product [Macaca fascicularis]